MTTMQKFKAYFGMVPPSEFEDDYLVDPEEPRGMSARERAYMEKYRSHATRDEMLYDEQPYRGEPDFVDAPYREPAYAFGPEASYGPDVGYRERDVRAGFVEPGFGPEARPAAMRGGPDRPRRLEPLTRSANATVRGATAVAMDPHADVDPLSEASMTKISTLRPKDYSEARTIGERFRGGSPVIMDLADMSNDEAKRLVDFAAGLVFALRGSFDKVATKVFLLSPSGVDVTPEERRRIAESSFHNQL
ncbi:cell division protein SepF [Gordonia shandongensis]|uniref:cell division protein SepF n=1 Tax=Gordonia shandongensis TaxID=376351 RepID=UPI00040491A8|nr:cell division protein SepF [Gordonia shandongensis]